MSSLMSLSFSASRCQRLSVRISIGSHAPKFQSKIVNRSQDEPVHWFPPSRPRKFLIVNAQLRKGMSVNQSPSKSAMMSMNRAKCVDDEQCSNVGSRKCAPAIRQECTDVVEQVPRQTYETECKTEYTQECSQSRSGYGS